MVISLLILINLVRSQPLVEDRMLTQRAEARAEQLCQDHAWSHDGWLKSFDGLTYQFAGENLAKGFNSDLDAFNALMASPTHKANIVRSTYTKIGVAHSKKCDLDVMLFSN